MQLKNNKKTQKKSLDIGVKIQELINQNNLSLSKVASATGLSSESIRQIINGTIKNPGIETLSKIAEAFSITLFDLLESRNITSHIHKKNIKIIDIFDIKKLGSNKQIDDILNQSTEFVEILYVDDNVLNSDFFAIAVNNNLAEKLTNCGMPMLNEKDLLIFYKNGDYFSNSIVLARCEKNILTLCIVMEIEEDYIWVKSVELPQKQIVAKIKKQEIIGIVHNVQFNKQYNIQ